MNTRFNQLLRSGTLLTPAPITSRARRGGKLQGTQSPWQYDSATYVSPRTAQSSQLGWRHLVAFQARNPMHRTSRWHLDSLGGSERELDLRTFTRRRAAGVPRRPSEWHPRATERTTVPGEPLAIAFVRIHQPGDHWVSSGPHKIQPLKHSSSDW